jgi:pyruvate kinase
VPVLAFTPEPAVRSQLAMSWGIETFLVGKVEHTDEMAMQVDRALLDIERLEEGETVVIVAGSPPGIPGSTNAMRVHRMGDAKNGVAPAYRSAAASGS